MLDLVFELCNAFNDLLSFSFYLGLRGLHDGFMDIVNGTSLKRSVMESNSAAIENMVHLQGLLAIFREQIRMRMRLGHSS